MDSRSALTLSIGVLGG
ncbi:hypothetical protein, partial [Mycolicibacterium frederiksbergense]